MQGTWHAVTCMSSSFWLVRVADEASKDKLTFVTPRGAWRYKVMPMGIVSAPGVFAHLGQRAFADLITAGYMSLYIDDACIHGNSFSELLHRLRMFFDAVRAAHLKLSPDKCLFGATSMKLLGHMVTQDGLIPDPDKIQAVQDYPTPTCVRDVRAFLGLTGYYRRFVQGYAALAAPLYTLTSKDAAWVWTAECQAAFDALRQALIHPPILRAPDSNRQYILYTDWSPSTVAAILGQKDDEGREYVVAYASHKLNKSQVSYAATQGECRAVVWSFQHFRTYLHHVTAPTIVWTDHWSLKYLLTTNNLDGSMGRWALYLQQYDFVIQHRKGRMHNNVDAFTRLSHRIDALSPASDCTDSCDEGQWQAAQGGTTSSGSQSDLQLLTWYDGRASDSNDTIDSLDAPRDWQPTRWPNPPSLVISIEGNVGAGKSTAADVTHVSVRCDRPPWSCNCIALGEPVDTWQPYVDDYYEALNSMPTDSTRLSALATLLQMHVIHTHLREHAPVPRYTLTERSA